MTDHIHGMQALVCVEPGRLELKRIARPGSLAPGQVRLAIENVGICGTDYHIHAGRQPFLSYPRIMGHEISAKILEVAGETDLAIGSRVVVNPYVACGACIACRSDKPNCCMAISVLGVHGDGAMCEEIIVPAINVYPANDLTAEQAASVEFLAIGAHAVRRSMAKAGARTLVIGAGPIGIGTALFARIAGLDVTIMDSSAERLAQIADVAAFSSTILAEGTQSDAISKLTGGEGFDAVFDATGNKASMEGALFHVAHGGVLVYVGLVKDDLIFHDPEFHKREMMMIASRNAHSRDFDHVIASIRNGLVPVERLITHRISLEGAVLVLPAQVHDKTGLIKTMITLGAATP